MNQSDKTELARTVVELIDEDVEVQQAILAVLFRCPNIPVKY